MLRLFANGFRNAVKLRIYGSSVIEAILREPRFPDSQKPGCSYECPVPHKWWSMSSSLPPLVSEGGALVCESVGKADLLSDHFDSKQSMEAVDLPLTCLPSPSFATFAFRS